ncbi:MAG: LytTR family DNA-binding domain-containing protein [Leeuwenhoekiella sp.]
MIKAIAIDDEPLALQVVDAFCCKIDYLTLEKTFTSQTDAIKYLNKFDVDLLFLDIQMPRKNGIELYKSLKNETKVIFTTAYSDYAVEGFNVNATDYILKPYAFDRFEEAVAKVKREIELEKNSIIENTHLVIRADYKLYNIPLKSIIYLEAMDDYVKIYQEDEPVIVARSTMKGVLKKLPQQTFTRIHKSFIISNSKVQTLQATSLTIADIELPIGSTYKDNVLEVFS